MTERVSLTALAHHAVAGIVQPGDAVIDATAGNGHDTGFLAGLVGPEGKVYAFDIQPQALEATRQRLETEGLAAQVVLLDSGHERLDVVLPTVIKGRIAAIMFNLGYLPGSNKRIVTQSDTTIKALEIARDWLMPGGILTVMAYPGHGGGADELDAVRRWLDSAHHLNTEMHRGASGNRPSPVLFISRRLASEDNSA